MKTMDIIRGEKEELLSHLWKLSESANAYRCDSGEFSKQGIEQQLSNILSEHKGVGIVFTLQLHPKQTNDHDVHFVLCSQYVHVVPQSK